METLPKKERPFSVAMPRKKSYEKRAAADLKFLIKVDDRKLGLMFPMGYLDLLNKIGKDCSQPDVGVMILNAISLLDECSRATGQIMAQRGTQKKFIHVSMGKEDSFEDLPKALETIVIPFIRRTLKVSFSEGSFESLGIDFTTSSRSKFKRMSDKFGLNQDVLGYALELLERLSELKKQGYELKVEKNEKWVSFGDEYIKTK
jgi:hypothetical protein